LRRALPAPLPSVADIVFPAIAARAAFTQKAKFAGTMIAQA
jgi:hypothetical protein